MSLNKENRAGEMDISPSDFLNLTWNCYAIAECAKRGPGVSVIGFYNSSTLSSYTYIGSTIIIVKNSFFFFSPLYGGGKKDLLF
jgi:hypothetical protein